MIFRHIKLEKTLEWTDNTHMCELVVEHPQLLRQILRDFNIDDKERSLGFSNDGETLNFEKEVDVIFNPLKLDFNNRRAMATLLRILVKASLSETFYLETSKLKTKIVKYLGNLVDNENFNFEVITSDFGIDDLAKATNLHIVDDEDDFIELLTNYMAMMAELAGIKIFVFVNLRTLIDAEELQRLEHDISNHQLAILLVESRDAGKIENIPRIIVDHDQCEL